MSDKNEVYEIAYRRMMADDMRARVCKFAGVDKRTFTSSVHKHKTPMYKTVVKMVKAMEYFGYFPPNTDPVQVLPPRSKVATAKEMMPRSDPGDALSELWIRWINDDTCGLTVGVVGDLMSASNDKTRNQARKVMETMGLLS